MPLPDIDQASMLQDEPSRSNIMEELNQREDQVFPVLRVGIERCLTDNRNDEKTRVLAKPMSSFPRGGKKKQVSFASTCMLVVFPRRKAKYNHLVWYQEKDFFYFKESANLLTASIQSHNDSHHNLIAHFGIDCFYGLEKVISDASIARRRRWRASAYKAVFSLQQNFWQEKSVPESQETGSHKRWLTWESIAISYAKTVAESNAHAFDLAQIYAASNPEDEKKKMVEFLKQFAEDSSTMPSFKIHHNSHSVSW